jgi:hypothetical protein
MPMRPFDERPYLPLDQVVELILPAKFIPGGATVRKVHGRALFTLVRRVRLYVEKGVVGMETKMIEGNGCVFLEGVDQEGTFNVYPPEREFVWIVKVEELVEQLQWQDRKWSTK